MAVMAALIGRARRRAGGPPRRVHRRRRALAHLAGRRRAPGHRGRGRATATTSSPAATPATTPTRPPTAAGWRSGPSSPSSSPTCAGCSGASSGPTTSSTTTSRTRSGPTSGPPSPPRTATPGWPSWPRADTCVTPGAVGGRAGRRRPVRGPPRLRRGGHRPAGADGSDADRFRQVGAGAGRHARRPTSPSMVGDPLRSDTDRLLAAAGLAPAHIAELRERGIVA